MGKNLTNSIKMRKFLRHFEMGKAQRSGFFILIILILIIELGFYFLSLKKNDAPSELMPEELEWLKIKEESTHLTTKSRGEVKYFTFNPNEFSAQDWQKIGFSSKQSEIIIKYRNSLGGNFENLAQIQECFVISQEKFEEMKMYIRLKNIPKNQINSNSKEFFEAEKILPKSKKKLKIFDPNQLSLKEWEDLGFSEKQAKVILNYKENYLKGEFKNLNEIKNCFVISEAKFNELKAFIRLPQKNSEKGIKSENISPKSSDFHVNSMNELDWKKCGATAEEAKNIVKYRDFIGGFENFKALENCPYLNEDVLEKLKNKALIF